jgi:hypothetical protein
MLWHELNNAEVSANRASWTSVKVKQSKLNILKSVGKKYLPCGTPERSPYVADPFPETFLNNKKGLDELYVYNCNRKTKCQ